jgi:hypothetical protein
LEFYHPTHPQTARFETNHYEGSFYFILVLESINLAADITP